MCDYTGEELPSGYNQLAMGNARKLEPEEVLKYKYDQALANLENAQAHFELIKWAKIAVMAAPLTPKAQSLLVDKL